MAWPPALTDLRAALEDMFASPELIGSILDDAGVPRAGVNVHSAPREAWHAALAEAVRHHRLEPLIAAVRRQYPTNIQLGETCDRCLKAAGEASQVGSVGASLDCAPRGDKASLAQ